MPRRQNWQAAVSRETVKPLQFVDFGGGGEMPLFSDPHKPLDRAFCRVQADCRYSDAFIAYWLYGWRWHEWDGLWYLTAQHPDWYPYNLDPPTDRSEVPFKQHAAWMNGCYSVQSTGLPPFTSDLSWAWEASNLCSELDPDRFHHAFFGTTWQNEWLTAPQRSAPQACALLCRVILSVITHRMEREHVRQTGTMPGPVG